MFLAEDLLDTVIKKVWLLSLNNDNIEEVPPIFSHHVLHAFVSKKGLHKTVISTRTSNSLF